MSLILVESLESMGLKPSDEQIEQFEKFYEMLIEKNKVMNLTAITEYEDVVLKHFADSCSVVKTENKEVLNILNSENAKLLDIGTGAGFPGIPLKIMFPNLEITLMDSLNKRINFLNEVIRDLKLEKIQTVHARAEEFARKPEFREQYDLIVSRAVAKMSSLSEYCIPYLKVGGFFLPYKSGNAEEEILEGDNAIKTLGCKLLEINKFSLGKESSIDRMIPIVKKDRPTPGKYPRVGRKADKNPL